MNTHSEGHIDLDFFLLLPVCWVVVVVWGGWGGWLRRQPTLVILHNPELGADSWARLNWHFVLARSANSLPFLLRLEPPRAKETGERIITGGRCDPQHSEVGPWRRSGPALSLTPPEVHTFCIPQPDHTGGK